jgi:hypothetical protein
MKLPFLKLTHYKQIAKEQDVDLSKFTKAELTAAVEAGGKTISKQLEQVAANRIRAISLAKKQG